MEQITKPGSQTQDAGAGDPGVIVTQATLENLLKTVQRVDIKIDHLYEKFSDVRRENNDHEVRLRTVEQALTTIQASRGTATWLWQAVWPTAAVIIAVLSYLNAAI